MELLVSLKKKEKEKEKELLVAHKVIIIMQVLPTSL
jgi:hypothetical protein